MLSHSPIIVPLSHNHRLHVSHTSHSPVQHHQSVQCGARASRAVFFSEKMVSIRLLFYHYVLLLFIDYFLAAGVRSFHGHFC
jgi:hypothetical protein